jgi:hypothetical protein
MTITIAASVDFSLKIIEVKKELEEMGHTVNIPFITQKIIDGQTTIGEFLTAKENAASDLDIRAACQLDLIKRYWDYIRNSDAILVLNLRKKEIDNYIGGNVLMELGFAYGHGKKIYLYNPIPARGERMHYVDEIVSVKPIVIDGDLRKIK